MRKFLKYLLAKLTTSKANIEQIRITAQEECDSLLCEITNSKSEIEYLETNQAENHRELVEEKKNHKLLVEELNTNFNMQLSQSEAQQMRKLKEVEFSKQNELAKFEKRYSELQFELEKLENWKRAEVAANLKVCFY